MSPVIEIKVGNVFHDEITHYCGRPKSYSPKYGKNFSVLGNPFFMKNESLRTSVIDKYKGWFYENVAGVTALKDPKVSNAMSELIMDSIKTRKVVLGCFCHPKACHCDVIKEYLEKVLEEA